nr:MAG TPA: hypothetical protein [Caudoviricetes sp.]
MLKACILSDIAHLLCINQCLCRGEWSLNIFRIFRICQSKEI